MNNKRIFLYLMVAVCAAGFFLLQKKEVVKNIPQAALSIPMAAASVDTISIMDSPEGSKTLTLEEGALYTSSKGESDKTLIYKRELAGSDSFEIPFNTWSPNTGYFFIRDKTTTPSDYLVFQSSGVMFATDSAYLSIQNAFREKVQGYEIEDVTGWADNTLLVVNTKNLDDEAKVSFWYDVSSRSFIQLSTYFR